MYTAVLLPYFMDHNTSYGEIKIVNTHTHCLCQVYRPSWRNMCSIWISDL